MSDSLSLSGSSAPFGGARPFGTLRRAGWFVSTVNATVAIILVSVAFTTSYSPRVEGSFRISLTPTDPMEYFVLAEPFREAWGGMYAFAVLFQLFMLVQFARRMASAGYGTPFAVAGYLGFYGCSAFLTLSGLGQITWALGLGVLVVGCLPAERRA